jgi:hypothetical protein
VGKKEMNIRNRAFVSYSHADVEHLARLQVHLAPYIREKKIDVWDDTRITPGARWKEESKNFSKLIIGNIRVSFFHVFFSLQLTKFR